MVTEQELDEVEEGEDETDDLEEEQGVALEEGCIFAVVGDEGSGTVEVENELGKMLVAAAGIGVDGAEDDGSSQGGTAGLRRVGGGGWSRGWASGSARSHRRGKCG